MNIFKNVLAGLTANLCKIAFSFLSLSQSSSVTTNNVSEETYIVSQIRQHLSKDSKDKLHQFEILYNKIVDTVSAF